MNLYRTVVTELPATPLGLLPARWIIEHHCLTCRQPVATDELVAHGQTHDNTVHHQGGVID